MIPMIFLAAAASGIAVNLYGNAQSNRAMKAGGRADKAQLDLQMEQDSLASVEQSLFNTEQLREVMSSQRAIFGARGQMPGTGSALAIEQKSLRGYGADERARELSTNFRKTQLLGRKSLVDIQRFGEKAKMGAQLASQGMNMISTNAISGSNSTESLNTKPIENGAWKNPNKTPPKMAKAPSSTRGRK